MTNAMDAVRVYFEARNSAWITGDLDSLRQLLTTVSKNVLRSSTGRSIHAKQRATRFRNSRLLRAHTRVNVRDIEVSDAAAEVMVDEKVSWVYRDGADFGVESRVIRHWQRWELVGKKWQLVKDEESDELHYARETESVVAPEETQRSELWFAKDRASVYDRVRAVKYAELWWDGYNPSFVKLTDDCTNFVSQCLFAGQMRMSGGQTRSAGWWFKFKSQHGAENWSFSWTTSNALALYLLNHIRATSISNARNLKFGDVVFYDWDGTGKYHHSALVVDFDANGDPLVNAHTDASYHRHYLYLDSRAWTPKTKYLFLHLPDQLK